MCDLNLKSKYIFECLHFCGSVEALFKLAMWEEKLRLMYKVMKLIYYNFVLYVSYDTMIHSVIKIRCEIMKIKYI